MDTASYCLEECKMKIQITPAHQISSYRYGWKIEVPRARKGESKWQPVSYYTTLEQAVNSLGHRLVRESDAQTLADALAEIDRVTATLCQALSPQFRVEVDS